MDNQIERTEKLGILTEKGVYFDLRITENDHLRLESPNINQDEEGMTTDSILTKYLKSVRTLPYSDDTVESLKLKGWGLPMYVPFLRNKEGILTPVEKMKQESNQDDITIQYSNWDKENTHALISLVIENKQSLTDPLSTKKTVWNLIANDLQRMGHSFSGEMCDKKWRHLKSRFMDFKRRGSQIVKWQYFEAMKNAINNIAPLGNENTPTVLPVTEEHVGNIEIKESSKSSDTLGSQNVDQEVSGSQDFVDETVNAEREVPDERMCGIEQEAVLNPELFKQKNRPKQRRRSKKLCQSSEKKTPKMLKMPVQFRGFALLVKKEQHKTRKLMKTLIKEQQRSASLFEKLLAAIDILPHKESKEKVNKDP